MTNVLSEVGPRPFEGIKIIDSDTHLTEPADLWTARAPAKLKERMPQIRLRNGVPGWTIDGDMSMGLGTSAASCFLKDGTYCKALGVMDATLDDVHPASYDVKARLKVMDELGIWAQIVYPNLLGFGGGLAMNVDPDLRLLTTQIYNDFSAELQANSGDRLFPMALLPWWDVTASVREAERCAEMGLRGININSDPQSSGFKDLNHDDWNPLWELCSDLGLPVNFHIGFSDDTLSWSGNWPWPTQRRSSTMAIGGVSLFIANAKTLVNLLLSGLLERYPKLKFVSVESGLGWIPFVLEALDYQAEGASSDSLAHLSMKPSEYFKRQIFACYWFEQNRLVETARYLGVDNIMFESDFPHPTCLSPRPLEYIQKAHEAFTPVEQRKLLSENAAKLYNIPIA